MDPYTKMTGIRLSENFRETPKKAPESRLVCVDQIGNHTPHILLYFRLNTLNGIAKILTVFRTLSSIDLQILTPKRYYEHPVYFMWDSSPPPPLPPLRAISCNAGLFVFVLGVSGLFFLQDRGWGKASHTSNTDTFSSLTLMCTTSCRTKRGRLLSEMTRGPVSVSRSLSSSLNLRVTMLDALSSGLTSTSAKLN